MKNFIRLVSNQAKTLSIALGVGLTLFIMLSFGNLAVAQTYVATTSVDINPEFLLPATVTSPDNAVGAPDASFSTITVSGIVVTQVLTNSSDASLTLNFTQSIPAGKKTYVRIDEPTGTGLSLDVGNLVNLLNLLSNNTIEVTTSAGTAQKVFVRDEAGDLYIAVTSTSNYNSITIKLDFGNSVGLAGITTGTLSLNVYHAISYESMTSVACDPINFTGINPEATGIDITLAEALQNPEDAIDGDRNTFSTLQNGTVGVVSNVYQNFYLGKSVPGSNEVVATISQPEDLLDLSVLANITIQAFNGNTPVGTPRTIQEAFIELNLSIPFGNGELVTIAFVPGGTSYDRIVVRSATVAGVSLFTGLNIHEINSLPPIKFTGGLVANGQVGKQTNSPITAAISTNTPVVLPGFSLNSCGTGFTYTLFNVAKNGRIMAGSLPGTLVLSPQGVLTGIPAPGTNATYTFDVQVTNNTFGQRAVAQFVIIIDGPLPVKLISFTAKAEGQTASLAWSTSEETNSDRFDIERSVNGKIWSKIGSVASNHESLSLQNYYFADSSPFAGENLYRLKMIDRDDTFAYSSIENLTFSTTLSIYPNPIVSTEKLQINVDDWTKVKSIKIINSIGKTVFQSTDKLISGIKTEFLTSGLYIIQIIQNDGKTSINKFIKM